VKQRYLFFDLKWIKLWPARSLWAQEMVQSNSTYRLFLRSLTMTYTCMLWDVVLVCVRAFVFVILISYCCNFQNIDSSNIMWCLLWCLHNVGDLLCPSYALSAACWLNRLINEDLIVALLLFIKNNYDDATVSWFGRNELKKTFVWHITCIGVLFGIAHPSA
jgi:hypothetical protein